MTIAGQTFTVSQPACTYTLGASSATVPNAGGGGSVNVTTNGTACQWTASTADSWITINSGTPGTGNGTVTFTAAAGTPTVSRTGTITIGGQSFTVNQDP